MGTSQEQYFNRTLKTCATLLERWKGASAMMWELTASHKSLRIVLMKEGSGNLLLACLDPIRLRGPIRWENSDLLVSKAQLQEGEPEGFLVVDAGADVEILCGGIEVKENVKLY
jgi:hypothetical protein